MSFLEQTIQLLSDAPGSVVYHLVILLAMQAALGVAAWQWRRNPEDKQARRLAWAAGGMIAGRLAMMIAALLSGEGQTATAVLPPLEHFVDALTAVMLIWAVAPSLPQLPRLSSVALLIVLLFTGVIYLFLAQNWHAVVINGTAVASYNFSQQAIVWSVYQLALLILGLIVVIIGQQRDWPLRSFIILILGAAHLLRLINFPETPAAATDIAYWTRMGNLIALPLFAALAYRHNLAELLRSAGEQTTSREQIAQYLKLSRQVIASLDSNHGLKEAAALAVQITPASFAALAILSLEDKERLRLTTSHGKENERLQWGLVLSDWPALRLALQQRQQIELIPVGIGARQLHDLCRELAVPNATSALIEPLLDGARELGVLILINQLGERPWQAGDKAVAPYLAAYIAQTVANSRRYDQALRAAGAMELAEVTEGEPTTGRLITLEKEKEAAQARVETLLTRLNQTEEQLFAAHEQLRLLSTSSGAAQATNGQVALLENEIEALRESLLEAEEAMAIASATEAGVSAEWVMLALTRYSGELEEAQARIQELEHKVAEWGQGETDARLTNLAQELWTPLTSIAGYTDLLLSETLGILAAKQINVLRRMEANVEQTESLLNEMITLLTAQEEPLRVDTERVDAHEMVETAVTALAPTLRDKGLRLYLSMEEPPAPVVANRNALQQILLHLLRHASQHSPADGWIAVQAQTKRLTVSDDPAQEAIDFLQVTVSENGAPIPLEERLRLFQSSQRLNGEMGESSQALTELYQARSLIVAHGGRIWVDNLPDQGNKLSALLPVTAIIEADTAAKAGAAPRAG